MWLTLLFALFICGKTDKVRTDFYDEEVACSCLCLCFVYLRALFGVYVVVNSHTACKH